MENSKYCHAVDKGKFKSVSLRNIDPTSGIRASQTSGGDEGLLDLYALNREVKRIKRQTLSQAKQIIKLKTKLKKLSKFVQPVVKHHAFWVESQNLKKRRKKQRKKHKKKVSSVKLGRNKDEGTLSEEALMFQDVYTADPFFEDIVDKDAAVTPDLERKSDETEEINIEEKEASNVKSGDTEELDLETVQSSEVRKGDLKEREQNGLLRQRKLHFYEEQPSKKLKVHTLELEDCIVIHMRAERDNPLSSELMIWDALDHGMEVEDEVEIAITFDMHLSIMWTTEDGDNS
ncbi:hypothetical protein Tco_0173152 [Tanacetum coccineum]